jgi:hypothetical protein
MNSPDLRDGPEDLDALSHEKSRSLRSSSDYL